MNVGGSFGRATYGGAEDALTTVLYSGFRKEPPPISEEGVVAWHQAKDSLVELADAIFTTRRIRERFYEGVGYKTHDAAEVDKLIRGADPNSRIIHVVLILDRWIRDALSQAGYQGKDPRTIDQWEDVCTAIKTRLRELEATATWSYEALAFLNAPTVDASEPLELCQVEVGGHTTTIWLAQATDADLARVGKRTATGYELPVGVDQSNALVRFEIRLAVDSTLEESLSLYPKAAGVVRLVLDLLRMVRPEDLGVHYLEIAEVSFPAPTIRRNYAFDYQPEMAPWSARRGMYWGPPAEPVSDDEMDLLRRLATRYISGDVNLAGFDTAIRRFRDGVERYAPDDPERLLDLAIALEALFLNDDPKSELSFRLALRAARFLRGDIESRMEVHARLKDLYQFRSKLAHGVDTRQLRPAEKARLALVERDALPLLRESLRRMLLGEGPWGLAQNDRLARWWTEFMLQ